MSHRYYALTEIMKSQLRSLAQALSPELVNRYRSRRSRAYFRQQYGSIQEEAYRVLFNLGTPRILSGPFRGMPYLNEIVWGPIMPKWIGCYEAELHATIEQIGRGRFLQVVNVGCAEGYYAVGLAWRFPGIQVLAFDLDPIARKQTGRLASLVGVGDRVKIGAHCTARLLNELTFDRTLLAIDIEGGEVDLLNPEEVPNLVRASMLVELHSSPALDLASAGETLTTRFKTTHDFGWFDSQSRASLVHEYRSLWDGKVSAERFAEYLDEGRSERQRWLWAQPRAGASPALAHLSRAP